jgi:hypothetical protein
MTRFRIVAVTAAAMIALAAWWVPPEVGGGHGCPGVGACAEGPPAPGDSGGPDWFYGGEGMDRIRGGGGDRPDTREEPGDANRCGPGRYEAPTGAGGEERPRGCEDVRARFY